MGWGGNNVLSAFFCTCYFMSHVAHPSGCAFTMSFITRVRGTITFSPRGTNVLSGGKNVFSSIYFTSTYSTLSCLPSMFTNTTSTYFTSTYSTLSCLPSMRTCRRRVKPSLSKLNGTQTLDRTWDICKQSIPRSLSSRKGAVSGMLGSYVHVWWWRHHHEGKDLLTLLGKLCSAKNAK